MQIVTSNICTTLSAMKNKCVRKKSPLLCSYSVNLKNASDVMVLIGSKIIRELTAVFFEISKIEIKVTGLLVWLPNGSWKIAMNMHQLQLYSRTHEQVSQTIIFWNFLEAPLTYSGPCLCFCWLNFPHATTDK